MPKPYETDLQHLALIADTKQEENDAFLRFVQQHNNSELDDMVHAVNDRVSAAVDCTNCGNCCKTLVINVTQDEVVTLAQHLNIAENETREKYIEESMMGNCFINTMPCHFLNDNMCTIYEARFTECRDFPHLHKQGFKARLGGTLGHYHRCPIIYNVIEEVKVLTGFTAV